MKHKKKLDDDIKQTVIRGIVPEMLRKHLEMNSSIFVDSDDMLEEVAGYIQSQTGSSAMDISWLGKGKDGGKGAGTGWWDKGKGGKGFGGKDGKGNGYGGKNFGGKGSGKGKDGKSEDGKGKGKPFQGYCDNCQKWGIKRQTAGRAVAMEKDMVARRVGKAGSPCS